MDWQPFINTGLGAACAVFGWIARTFYTDIRALEHAIASHREMVARDYATNGDIARIENKLDDILRYLRK